MAKTKVQQQDYRVKLEAKKLEALRLRLKDEFPEDDLLVKDMIEGETPDLDWYLDRCLEEMVNADVDVLGISEVIKALVARSKAAQERIERIRLAIKLFMLATDQKTIKRPLATLTMKDPVKTFSIPDEKELSSDYFVTQPLKLDRAALRKDFLAGKKIDGIVVDNGEPTLSVRVK